MNELEEYNNTRLFHILIDSEKYDLLLFLLWMGLKKALVKRTSEIKKMKNKPPSFNTEDMIRKGELGQLKLELLEFIDQLQDTYGINLNDEFARNIFYLVK